MGKRMLLNMWLAAALLALVWVVWQEPGQAPKKEAAVKLTAVPATAITKIAITNHDGTITLGKELGEWRLLEPVAIAANPVRVDDLLQVLQAESLVRFPAAGRDLSQYGLAAPAVKLRVNDTELLFGGVTPVDQQRYVKLGDTIHLIADRYMFDLTGDAAALVSRDLVPHGKRIVALDLPDKKLSRNEKGEWSMMPADKGVSSDAVQVLVNAWRDVQALRVAAYAKQAAQGEVVIGIEGEQQPLRYQITARKPDLILARPEIGMQFYVAAEQAESLFSVKAPARDAAASKKN
jgi:hypothetical protein